jgi:dienelactone hydrolase
MICLKSNSSITFLQGNTMTDLKSTLIAATLAAAATSTLAADTSFKQSALEYPIDATTYQSELFKPHSQAVGGVLLVPDWTGINDHARFQARRMAELGRIVLVVDLYGKNVRPGDDTKAADAASSPMINDRQLAQKRMQAALKALRTELPAGAKVVGMGYSFGALAALELARSGADVVGTVVAWPVLGNPTPDSAKKISGPVLVLQGTQDAYSPMPAVQAFAAEMDAASRSYEITLYGGAKHGFTIPGIPNTKENPLASDPAAAAKAAQQTDDFLNRVLGKK